MGRVQLALNVTDLDEAVDFYSTLFDTAPHKRRPGYANFAVSDPPLKLVLFEGAGAGGTLNHLGVETATADEVAAATARLGRAGLDVDVRAGEVCCHARQDKVWVTGPDTTRWEVYTVVDDDPATSDSPRAETPACC